ncbi:hypothetical protein JCM10450v2_007672 [Rhodotorula kratochvilovae]
MQNNYLGLSSRRGGGASGSSSSFGGRGNGGGPPGGQKYGKQPTATPSTRCQKCNALGHWSFECTGQREYKVRSTRTQILKNPKLRTPLTESAPPRTEDMPREGTAAAILAANEAKRLAKLEAARRDEDSNRGRSSRRRGSSVTLPQPVAVQVALEDSPPLAVALSLAEPLPSAQDPRTEPLHLPVAVTLPLAQQRPPALALALRLARAVALPPRQFEPEQEPEREPEPRAEGGSASPAAKRVRRESRGAEVEGKGKGRAD